MSDLSTSICIALSHEIKAKVCGSHGVPIAAAALQFPLGHSIVASVIPGARSGTEMAQNITLFETNIPAALWSDLQSEKLLDEQAPLPV